MKRWACAGACAALLACSEPSPREGTLPTPAPSPSPRARVDAAVARVAVDAAAGPDPAALEADPPSATPGWIEDATGQALLPLYRALARLDGGEPVRVGIVQLGDSLTAADFQTSTMRARLQARFGDAGRGFLLPGKPIKHYYLGDAKYGTEGVWDVEYGMKKSAVEPVGLGGVRIHSGSTKVSAWVATCSKCGAGRAASRVELWYRRTPESGSLAITIDDGAPRKLSMRTPAGAAAPELTAVELITLPDGEHKVTLRPVGDGVVDLFAVMLEREPPGIVLDAIGVVGARAAHLERWDWAWVAEQLGRRAPSLVVLAYGTNEVDDDENDLVRFENRLVELVARVRAAVPDAAVMIQGPPDRGKRELGRACNKPPKKTVAKPKKKRGEKRAPAPPPLPPGAVRPGCEWKTASTLEGIVAAERRAALRAGAAFFDVYAAMGGVDRSDVLFKQEPRWFYQDHVHLTGKGGGWVAGRLLEDLMGRYDAWRVRRGMTAAVRTPSPPWPVNPPLPPSPDGGVM